MTIQGPAIFLAQFMGDEAPFNSFDSICAWASELGYLGVQVPSWDPRCFDLEKAAKSKAYCEEIQGVAASHGLEITELSTHLQGQLVAVHPAYASMFQAFAPKGVKTPKDMQPVALNPKPTTLNPKPPSPPESVFGPWRWCPYEVLAHTASAGAGRRRRRANRSGFVAVAGLRGCVAVA